MKKTLFLALKITCIAFFIFDSLSGASNDLSTISHKAAVSESEEQNRIEEKIQANKRVEQGVEEKLQEQKIESEKLEEQRDENKRIQRKLDDERWQRAHER